MCAGRGHSARNRDGALWEIRYHFHVAMTPERSPEERRSLKTPANTTPAKAGSPSL